MTDQEINKELQDNNICPHCGGKTYMRTIPDYDHDEIYTLTTCEDCGYEEE